VEKTGWRGAQGLRAGAQWGVKWAGFKGLRAQSGVFLVHVSRLANRAAWTVQIARQRRQLPKKRMLSQRAKGRLVEQNRRG